MVVYGDSGGYMIGIKKLFVERSRREAPNNKCFRVFLGGFPGLKTGFSLHF